MVIGLSEETKRIKQVDHESPEVLAMELHGELHDEKYNSSEDLEAPEFGVVVLSEESPDRNHSSVDKSSEVVKNYFLIY